MSGVIFDVQSVVRLCVSVYVYVWLCLRLYVCCLSVVMFQVLELLSQLELRVRTPSTREHFEKHFRELNNSMKCYSNLNKEPIIRLFCTTL